MKTLIVKNQAEWDALPDAFPKMTAVHIYSDPKVPLVLKRCPDSSTVVARENATVEAWENATVRAWENATVEARENATVRAWGNATVVAWENATVEAWENATVVARENATVVAWGNATVEAWENATVVAWENATVVARENATVRAWGNATVVARENVIIRLLSGAAKAETFHSVTVICQDCKPSIKRHGTGVTVVRTETFKHSLKSFCEIYGTRGKPLTLYKSVKKDGYDHYTGKIKYEGIVECPDFDPNPERQCGGGLHLSPTPDDALRYYDGKVLVCEVARKDIVVYATDVTKVRCRKVTVVGEWKPEQDEMVGEKTR